MRNRRFHRMGRAPRTPVEFERFFFNHATTAGSSAAHETVLASPLSFEPNVVDSNWTLRRIRLELVYSYQYTIQVADDQALACLGLYKKDLNNPVVADASAPKDEDWLDLWVITFPRVPSGTLIQAPLMIEQWGTRKPKVSRKLNQGEAIFFTQTLFHFSAAQSTSFQLKSAGVVSNLWARTAPRR